MKKLIAAVFVSMILFSVPSCTSSRYTIDTSNLKAGMSKKEVVEQLGKPYKTEFYTNEYNEVIERCQYAKLMLGTPIDIHFLEFRDGKLISLHSPNNDAAPHYNTK